MIIDIRYHIFTITAIFASLGLGILIGTTIIGQEGLAGEQERLIAAISREIQVLQEERKRLNTEVNQLNEKLIYHRQLGTEVVNLLLDERLAGDEFTILAREGNVPGELLDMLDMLGVSVRVVAESDSLTEGRATERLITWNYEGESGLLAETGVINLSDSCSLKENFLKIVEGEDR